MMSKGFELHKCYEHLGGSKLHTIAIAKESEMWFVNKDKGMLIAEGRDGLLQQISTEVEGAVNWYEITRDIFINNENFIEFKHETLTYKYRLRIYENGTVYLFNLHEYYDEHGLLTNLVEDDNSKVLTILKGIVDDRVLTRIEKMLFERI